MSYSEIESFRFPGDKPQKWWETLLFLVSAITMILSLFYVIDHSFDKLKTFHEQVEEAGE